MSLVLSVENLSKSYRLGTLGSRALRDDLSRWWARFRGRPDPLSRVGDDARARPHGEPFLALQDVSFDVVRGEVLGIIGPNGAGKSTLLKILSQVTAPTTGRIRIRGRIASLLEVGTGFHPELTGRENVFLNGAILGMRKREIANRYDEIVAFSGVERFIDTPVKRYSSGMRVRLAFAVAAHLEPEILVIDEVLAVGDVEFQRKCLGKMQAVGREGRTILFVSHNMSAVSSLCTRAIYLDTGMVQYDGAVKMALAQYLTPAAGSRAGYADVRDVAHRAGPREFSRLLSIETLGAERGRQGTFVMGDMMRVTIAFELQRSVDALEVGFTIRTPGGATLQTFLGHWENLPTSFGRGTHRVECAVPSIGVFPGSYVICPWVKRHSEGVDDQIVNAISFSVVGSNIGGATEDLERYPAAGVFQRATWSTQPAPVESMDTAVPVTLS